MLLISLGLGRWGPAMASLPSAKAGYVVRMKGVPAAPTKKLCHGEHRCRITEERDYIRASGPTCTGQVSCYLLIVPRAVDGLHPIREPRALPVRCTPKTRCTQHMTLVLFGMSERARS